MEICKIDSLKIEIFDLAGRDRWNAALVRLPLYDDICFRPEYCALYETGKIRAEAFYCEDIDGFFLISYLKKPIADSGYFDFETVYGYGGVLASTHEKDFLNKAWSAFFDYCSDKRIVAGFLRFNPIFDTHLFADPRYVDIIKERDVVVMPLSDESEEKTLSRYSSDNRNKIRLAVKNGVAVLEETGLNSLSVFKRLYHRTMDRLDADNFYYFDDIFFGKIDSLLEGRYIVFIANIGGRPAAGAIAFFTEKILYYFLSGTSDEGRRVGAANVLRHEAVRFAKRKGLEYINFGGGRSSNENDSLLKFKKGFSKRTKNFYVGKFTVDQKEYARLCDDWQKNSPKDKIERYGKFFLRYRK